MAIADCGRRSFVCATPVKTVVVQKVVEVVTPVFVASFLAVPVYPAFVPAYPTFSVGYTPGYGVAPAAYGGAPAIGTPGYNGGVPAVGPNGAIPGGGNAPQPTNQAPRATGPQPSSLQALFANRCADCHQGDQTAAVKGGGMVLLEENNTVPNFSPAELSMIALYATQKYPSGRYCPPKNPIPVSEQQFLVAETERLRTEMRARAKEALAKPPTQQPPKAAEPPKAEQVPPPAKD